METRTRTGLEGRSNHILKPYEPDIIMFFGLAHQSVGKAAFGEQPEPLVAEQIDEVVLKSKNLPPKKSVEQVFSVCEGILCQPLENLTARDRGVLLGVLAQYTVMKRRYAEQERTAKVKKSRAKER